MLNTWVLMESIEALFLSPLWLQKLFETAKKSELDNRCMSNLCQAQRRRTKVIFYYEKEKKEI